MRNVGIVTTIVLSSAAVGGLILAVQMVPDIRRYLRMRAM